MEFTILLWILIGALVGYVAAQIVPVHSEQNTTSYVMIGSTGAVLGGCIARILGGQGVIGLNIIGMIITTCAALGMLYFTHFVTDRLEANS